MSDMVALTTEDQREAFEDAAQVVMADAAAGDVEARKAKHGPAAGEVTKGEVVRVLAEAYRGTLDLG